ncbi:Glucosamine-6-phosphate deaminase [Alkalibacterium sp. AK22]|uniref:glucosamine-6-phosphate deaminase n=1 Tax=Alkalibacterium sp. AK22 TaxID=1229520 RepID=UPI00044BFC41|nr:glucosamine-6-phosphate deaminase [Alkalibacterium sp. AK22]EXJ23663.1 Glucosamine-6-phosphate deaminase [Alkalibacterium sp. AK22]
MSFEAFDNIRVIKVKDKREGGEKAFEIVKEAHESGAVVFGLATGSTPETLYREIRKSDLDFSDKTAINLDEYVGLSPKHPQSYHVFMDEHLFSVKPFKVSFIPNGMEDEEIEIARYNQVIREHPIDLQILGIGTNAHIGFNEPGTSFDTHTHKVKLTQETVDANKRYFESETDVPGYAYSMGIQSILSAKKILLMAYGENKAEAIEQTLRGPVTEDVPSSILQTHPDVVIIIDEAAASRV